MTKLQRDIDGFLQRVRLGIDNGQRAQEIADALAVYGFDAARMAEGAALLATAEDLQAVQKREYSEQYVATSALNNAFATADKVFSTHRKLAKLALRDEPEVQTRLMLNQHKKQALDPWLGQAGVFYKNILAEPELLAAMGKYNITAQILQEGQAAVVNVANLNADQEKEKSEAQKATQTRNEALDALDEWYVEFRTVARIALEDDPQRLEALGLGPIP